LRILALDIGDKRIGIAFSDDRSNIATPLTTIQNDLSLKDRIFEIIERLEVDLAVIGLPLMLNGKEGQQAKKVRDLIKKMDLERNVKTVFFDERFTTKIGESNIKGMKKKNMSDVLSATVLLNDYIKKENNEK